MSDWSLSKLLAGLHDDIESRLSIARKTLAHPVGKGDASEAVWLQLLQRYLPKRYQAAKAHVVDSAGVFSEQIDIVVFDRQYSPFIFEFEDQTVIPAESVYAAFEAKQTVTADLIVYAKERSRVSGGFTVPACRCPTRAARIHRKLPRRLSAGC